MQFSASLKIDVNQFRLEFIYRAGSSPSGTTANAVEAPVGVAVRITLHQQTERVVKFPCWLYIGPAGMCNGG